MSLTHAELMDRLTERAAHSDTMRPLTPYEANLLKDMEAHAAALPEVECEYWRELPVHFIVEL